MFKFVLDGAPIVKKRPRFSRIKGKVVTYDSQRDDVESVQKQLMQQLNANGLRKRIKEMIDLDIRFYTPIAKSTPKSRVDKLHGSYDRRRSDLDNYLKFYLDAMNNLIYEDDSQIVVLCSEKRYDVKPRTEIRLRLVDENSDFI